MKIQMMLVLGLIAAALGMRLGPMHAKGGLNDFESNSRDLTNDPSKEREAGKDLAKGEDEIKGKEDIKGSF